MIFQNKDFSHEFKKIKPTRSAVMSEKFTGSGLSFVSENPMWIGVWDMLRR
jgi:hypothetical protein